MLSGRNVTTKSSPSRLIDTCLLKGSAFLRKDSTTSKSDIYATHMPTKPHESTVPAMKPIGQLMRVTVRAGRRPETGGGYVSFEQRHHRQDRARLLRCGAGSRLQALLRGVKRPEGIYCDDWLTAIRNASSRV